MYRSTPNISRMNIQTIFQFRLHCFCKLIFYHCVDFGYVQCVIINEKRKEKRKEGLCDDLCNVRDLLAYKAKLGAFLNFTRGLHA